MTVPIWPVAFAGLCLLLTGVSTEIDLTRPTVRPSPSTKARDESPNVKQSVTGSYIGDVFAFSCTNVCGNSGKVLRCDLKMNGICEKRYYVVCNGKERCKWQTIKGSCDDDSDENCERLLIEEGDPPFQRVSYLRSVGIVPVLKRRFNGVRRRDLGEQQQQQQTARASMAMTSGNAHAYAMDDNHMVQSHYGSGPIFSTIPDNSLLGFPFSFLSRLQNFKPGYAGNQPPKGSIMMPPPAGNQGEAGLQRDTAPPVPQQTTNWNGYHQPIPYSHIGGYPIGHYPIYQQPTGYNLPYGYADNYGIWGNRGRGYSPFTSFFNAVGLQDPMLLLQYLPVG